MDVLTAALCFQLPAADGERVDGWRTLIPAPDADGWIRGADGRAWKLSDPRAVVAAFDNARPIDANHAEELKAPNGDAAPAYGWIEQIRAADGGAIEGRLAFNPRGVDAVTGREYRYLSPVFKFDRHSSEIRALDSAALVNTPNFALALNRREPTRPDANDNPEANAMDLAAELRTTLNLQNEASEQQVLDAVKTQGSELATARNRPADTPPLDKFVPRADYDALATAKNAAEAQLAERDTADHNAKVETAISAAKAAGKITPATEAYHRANCRTAEGLDAFETYVAAAPEIGADSGLGDKTPGSQPGAALSDEEKAACRAMGVAEATFIERRDADAKAFG
ncbi:phage protease [Salinisphaera orenii]|uniref:phage protease n=1 Tax=Salinisphaera orenii TaxID=856731 RepID=UPI000DBE8DE2